VEGDPAAVGGSEYAVHHEHVRVYMRVGCGAKALDEGDRPRLGAPRSRCFGPLGVDRRTARTNKPNTATMRG
jgi:hypothetical protein